MAVGVLGTGIGTFTQGLDPRNVGLVMAVETVSTLEPEVLTAGSNDFTVIRKA
jgi:hypothetical protein